MLHPRCCILDAASRVEEGGVGGFWIASLPFADDAMLLASDCRLVVMDTEEAPLSASRTE